MTYQIKYTETTNPQKAPLQVDDRILNSDTSLLFPGKNFPGYGSVIGENFLHLLENFANSSAPSNPVEGQLWYDNTLGASVLKIFDGTGWAPAGAITKASISAKPTTGKNGDIWVSTDTQQLFIYSGSTWVLVGPQYSVGLKTGSLVETIKDITGNSNNVTSVYSDDALVMIVSSKSFTPQSTIPGFKVINAGINLSTTVASAKMWGTAASASGLLIGDTIVLSDKFVRTDATMPISVPLTITSNSGISIGSQSIFNIGTEQSKTVLHSKTDGNSVEVKVTSGTTTSSALYITSDSKIGINNTNPLQALDVNGNALISGNLVISGGDDTETLSSITTNGGLRVGLTSRLDGPVRTSDRVYLGISDAVVHDASGLGNSVLVPTNNKVYDLGADSLRFKTVYAQTFVGEFAGTITSSATFSGDLTASKLANATAFSLTGQVTSNTISFDGQNGGSAAFNTTISPSIITAQTHVTTASNSDQLLLYRTGIGSAGGLKRVTKAEFMSSIPTVPIGVIFPYSGKTPPPGYLLCDGSELLTKSYPALFELIKYTYKQKSLLIGDDTFALPDLRGRFPLGRDNMDNGLFVPSGNISVDAGGGASNRVTDIAADNVGLAGGSETHTLNVNNLPDHKHDLKSTNGNQYYIPGIPGATDSVAVSGRGLVDNIAYGLTNSGSVISSVHADPVNTMNPYLTINYIIYTGEQ